MLLTFRSRNSEGVRVVYPPPDGSGGYVQASPSGLQENMAGRREISQLLIQDR